MAKSKALSQCLDVQNFVYASLMAIREQCRQPDGRITMDAQTAMSVHKLAGAWETLVDRARILRGRPLPGSLRPREEKPRRMPRGYDMSPDGPVVDPEIIVDVGRADGREG